MRVLSIDNIGSLIRELSEVKLYRKNPKIYDSGVAVRIFSGVKMKTRENHVEDIRVPLEGQIKTMNHKILGKLELDDMHTTITDRMNDTQLFTKYVTTTTSMVWNEVELLELVRKYMDAVSVEHTYNHIRLPFRNKVNGLQTMMLPSNAFFVLHIDYNDTFKLYISNTFQLSKSENCYRLYVCEKALNGKEYDVRPDFIKELHDINQGEFQFIMKKQLGM